MEVSCCCIIYNHLYNFHHWFNTENSIHCFLFSFLFSFSCKLSWLVLHSTMTGMRFMMVFGGALLCNSLILNLHLFSFDSFIMTNEISSQDQSMNVHNSMNCCLLHWSNSCFLLIHCYWFVFPTEQRMRKPWLCLAMGPSSIHWIS